MSVSWTGCSARAVRSRALLAALLIAAVVCHAVSAQGSDGQPAAPDQVTLQALWARGEGHYAHGRLDEARRATQEALSLDPGNGRTWNYLGGISFSEGNYPQALERFKKAAAARPGDSRIFNNLATTYDQMGKVDRAIENYLTAIDIDPDYPVPYRNLGTIYAYKMRDRSLAREYWSRYLALAPRAADAGEVAAELESLE